MSSWAGPKKVRQHQTPLARNFEELILVDDQPEDVSNFKIAKNILLITLAIVNPMHEQIQDFGNDVFTVHR